PALAECGLQQMRASTVLPARRSLPSARQRWPIHVCRYALRGSYPMTELIVAFDMGSGRDALLLAARLPQLRWAKLGPVLFVREGPALIREFAQRGLEVFLDLKWHDIPNTVAGAVTAAREIGVAMATVHTLGGKAMLEAAAVAAAGQLAVVGVTVLTSHDAASYAGATGRSEVDLK